jgi:hypothetical protein
MSQIIDCQESRRKAIDKLNYLNTVYVLKSQFKIGLRQVSRKLF